MIINQEENSVAELRCTVTGNPTPYVEWTRLDGELSSNVIAREGYLRFNALRRSDEGTYRCYAHNNVGEADQTVQVFVRGGGRPQDPPAREEVVISPSQVRHTAGEEVHLRCSSTPRGRVSWSKAGSPELPPNAHVNGEELTIRYSTVTDSGRYICHVHFPSGTTRSSTVEVVISQSRDEDQPPKISTLERKYSVVQGGDFELTCEVSGTPYPEVVWSMVS